MSSTQLARRFDNWSELEAAWRRCRATSLAQLFAQDAGRAARMTIDGPHLSFDFSKHWLDDGALKALVSAAEAAGLPAAIRALLAGEQVNNTERRPALHTALRFETTPTTEEEREVERTLARMADLTHRIHQGIWRGFTDAPITRVVNIGIGGSDLGPRMVCQALKPYRIPGIEVNFVANIDGSELHDVLSQADPASTLFLVASKSFGTQETRENALTARQWLLDAGCPRGELQRHFVAMSAKVDKAVEFGIAAENVYPLYDWVGGRYSLWSAIGLPIALAVGMDNFNALRAGAHAMDRHFTEAPLAENIPVLMGLLMFWYSQFGGAQSQAVLPYLHHLALLPMYLQQLEMESNGKSVTRAGTEVDYQTGAVVWGTEGTNGQHSFHQLLHQGRVLIPVDFIAALRSRSPYVHQHRLLFANAVAQAQALMEGRDLAASEAELRAEGADAATVAALASHKVHPGNRPSSFFLLEELSPASLGALIAAYEHKVYTLAVMLDINPFDQWGVELGKLLGTEVTRAMDQGEAPARFDSSTQALLRRFAEGHL